MSDLKKCPFCGGEANFATSSHHWIECIKCGVQTEYIEDEEELIETWNTRIPTVEVVPLSEVYRYSECNCATALGQTNFYPNCGADMRGGKND